MKTNLFDAKQHKFFQLAHPILDADLTPVQKLVIMAIFRYRDPEQPHGRCWPSIETIATTCRVSKRTVSRALAEMRHTDEQPGPLYVEYVNDSTSNYWLNHDWFLGHDKENNLPMTARTLSHDRDNTLTMTGTTLPHDRDNTLDCSACHTKKNQEQDSGKKNQEEESVRPKKDKDGPATQTQGELAFQQVMDLGYTQGNGGKEYFLALCDSLPPGVSPLQLVEVFQPEFVDDSGRAFFKKALKNGHSLGFLLNPDLTTDCFDKIKLVIHKLAQKAKLRADLEEVSCRRFDRCIAENDCDEHIEACIKACDGDHALAREVYRRSYAKLEKDLQIWIQAGRFAEDRPVFTVDA